MIYFNDAFTLTVADDAVHQFDDGDVILIRSNKAFDYNHGGAVFFPLLANVNYEIDNTSSVVVHAPSSGGTVTLTVQVGLR